MDDTSGNDATRQSQEIEKDLASASERAEDALASRGQLYGLKTIDLREPLESLFGNLELVSQGAEGSLNQEQNKALGSATTICEGLISTLDRIIQLGRLKGGIFEVNRHVFGSAKCLKNSLGRHKKAAGKKGVELTINISIEHKLLADSSLFVDLIGNLVENAIRFCDQGDTVTVSSPKNNPFVISVKDTGPGIDTALIPDIFSTERKTATADTDGKTGAGLGLPLCYDIMQAHNGEITVESKPGKGSSFTCSFPESKGQILIVDDQENFRIEMVERLRGLNVGIVEAASGKEAIEILDKITPQLVLTDLVMDEIGGFELLEYIRKRPSTESIPVIVVTATEDMDTRDMGFKLGATDYVMKPLVQYDFLPRVKRFLPS